MELMPIFKYSLAKLIKSKRFEPFVGIGGGYSWIQEGEYNNNNVGKSNAKIGALTANGNFGTKPLVFSKYWTHYKHNL
jgi:hypothetical protein